MSSSSTIETKANGLNKTLPENEHEEVILENDVSAKKLINYCFYDNLEHIVNDYEALVFYIINGFKPNWLSKGTLFEPASILLSLYTNYANLFIEFIQSLKDDNNLLIRTVKLIDRNTFNSNYSFHAEVNNQSGFIEMNMDWLFESSLINGE